MPVVHSEILSLVAKHFSKKMPKLPILVAATVLTSLPLGLPTAREKGAADEIVRQGMFTEIAGRVAVSDPQIRHSGLENLAFRIGAPRLFCRQIERPSLDQV